MIDEFPTSCLVSESSKISERAFISSKVQVFADENSSIIIDDNVVVKDGAIILAFNNSKIHIKRGTYIEEKVFITADDNSEIVISEKSALGEKSCLRATEDSTIFLGSVWYELYEFFKCRKEFCRKIRRKGVNWRAVVYFGSNGIGGKI